MQKSTTKRALVSYYPFFRRLFVMKLTLMLTMASCICFAAPGRSQDTRMSINLDNASISTVLKTIERKTEYKFVYSNTILPENRVYLNLSDTKVSEILSATLQNTGISYKLLKDNLIVLSKVNQAAQAVRVTGIVTDERGEPLPGVSITVKGDRSTSSATDLNGHFNIAVPDASATLVFTYLGFESKEVAVGTNTSIRVSMKAKAGALQEVVVVGYGTTTRKLNTGSISSITSAEISAQPVDNLLTAMQGRLSGVQITQDNGLPGSGLRVQIRGNNSLSSGTIPLYVVDGVPFTLFNGGQPANDNLNAYGISGANGGVSPFSLINPSDIERIDVLKDADATAIYGSRGANGVVLITTKKGTAGRTSVNFNVYTGAGKVARFIPMLNTEEYLKLRKEAFANSGTTPTATNAPDLTVWDQNAYTDWQDWAIGGTANVTNANASISGGNAQNTFLFSSTYRKEGTVFPGDLSAQNFSNRINAGHKSKNNLFSIDLSASYNYGKNDLIGTDISSLYSLAPNYPLYNSNGTLNWTATNPLAYLMKTFDNRSNNLISNLSLGYSVLKTLKLKTNVGFTSTNLEQKLRNPAASNSNTTTGSLRYADSKNSTFIIEPQLDYKLQLGGSKISALAGTSFQNTRAASNSFNGSGYPIEALLNTLTGAGAVAVNYSNTFTYRYASAFTRLNYNFKDKYLLDGSFRRDGSSRFGEGNRFGNFGAIGAAWIFSSEGFMKNAPWLSFGKLRTSFGVTGNDQIPNDLFADLYNVSGTAYSYQGTPTLNPGPIPNANLGWETNKKLDLALELGFFKDRIQLKGNYFRNRSSNLLASLALPTQVGWNAITSNAPITVQNKGFEAELNSTNIKSADFQWSTNFNITFLRNELHSIENPSALFSSSSYFVGQPINAIRLYEFSGVDATTGLPTYKDQNGDGAITFNDDRIFSKTGNPFYGGINNSLSYKNFELNVFFRFEHRYGYLNNSLGLPYGSSSTTNTNGAALDRWKAAGEVTGLPKAFSSFQQSIFNYGSSTANWGDASFLKLKTVNLSYSLPSAWIKPAKISAASIYFQGQNLFTWAKQKYTLDPETTVPGTGSGLGTGQYIAMPQLRTLIIGLNCSF